MQTNDNPDDMCDGDKMSINGKINTDEVDVQEVIL